MSELEEREEQEISDTDHKTEEKQLKNTEKDLGKHELKQTDDGTRYYELDQHKRVSITKFKGKQFVDIREFYEKDGRLLPGKKGISMSVDNWNRLKSLVDEVDKCLNGGK